ncbi:MAG: hypothetical protein V4699_01260 [Patescibacteria group bacterium]
MAKYKLTVAFLSEELTKEDKVVLVKRAGLQMGKPEIVTVCAKNHALFTATPPPFWQQVQHAQRNGHKVFRETVVRAVQ